MKSPNFGQTKVILKNNVDFVPDLTYFAPAVLDSEGSEWYAEVSKGNGSGDLINIAKIDGFLVLPRGKSEYNKGEVYDFIHL